MEITNEWELAEARKRLRTIREMAEEQMRIGLDPTQAMLVSRELMGMADEIEMSIKAHERRTERTIPTESVRIFVGGHELTGAVDYDGWVDVGFDEEE